MSIQIRRKEHIKGLSVGELGSTEESVMSSTLVLFILGELLKPAVA